MTPNRSAVVPAACLLAASLGLPTIAGTINYTYDGAGRLIGADYGRGKQILYTYDNAGNLLELRVLVGFNVTTEANPPELGAVAGAGTYNVGAEALLAADPIGSAVFLGWGGDVFASGNPITFTVDADMHVVGYFGAPDGSTDNDGDGAVSREEMGPGGDDPSFDGDGNAVPDYQEDRVVSLHSVAGGAYVTLSVPEGLAFADARAVGNPSCGDAPAGVGFPYGLFAFRVTGLEEGACTTVAMDFPSNADLVTYYRYGPAVTPVPLPHWWEFLDNQGLGASFQHDQTRTRVTLGLCDGADGDDDMSENGVVVDPGGPGVLFSPAGLYDLIIAAAADTTGILGTRWLTDVDLLNPFGEDATVEIARLKANQANLTPPTMQVVVPAGQTVRVENILGPAGFNTRNAALGFRMLAGLAQVNSRFYNTASACGGTYGMYIASECRDAAIALGELAYLHHLSYSPDNVTGFRANVGFANATELTTNVEIKLYGDAGELLKTVPWTLAPYEHRQLTRIHQTPAPKTVAVTHGYATVQVLTPGGRVHTYAMLIENKSGDPIYIRAVKGFGYSPFASYDQMIAAAADTAGLSNTRWLTDADIMNTGIADATVRLSLLVWNTNNTTPTTADFVVPAGETVRLANLLGTTFDAANATNAAIGIDAVDGWAWVNSRFYNTASACGGTYGMYIPAGPSYRALLSGEVAYFHLLSYSPNNSVGFRTNVGFASDSPVSVQVEIRLFGDAGELLKTVTRTLKPYDHFQLHRIHASPAPATPAVSHGHAEVRVLTPGGRVHTYAMLIENDSGDPIFMLPEIVVMPAP